jgi:hypothetical protein
LQRFAQFVHLAHVAANRFNAGSDQVDLSKA